MSASYFFSGIVPLFSSSFQLLSLVVLSIAVLSLIILLLPIKSKYVNSGIVNSSSKDERDTMFSRQELIPGTSRFNEYYREHPDKHVKDDLWRAEPGLLSSESLFFNRLTFASADASFEAVKLFTDLQNIDPEIGPLDLSGTDVTRFIKAWSKKLGAVACGVTEMKDLHYYTHAGRGDRYGNAILKEHKYGIVILVEMDLELLASAPRSPVVMESANQYLRSAAIVTQLAVMIRKLGYKAKTHIDANYDIICPLVARDAGLGEIGRNGLLISDKFGPRVRIAVVTTDLPVQIDHPGSDPSVMQFCSICKKCAVNCPANSIPMGSVESVNGVMKWQLDQESCFTYWNHCGTDCGRCISTCPYSHKNNWFHNMIRRGIRNNIFFLHMAKLLDDLFYGKRPPSKLPDMMS
jgi:reductive dehalogenase